jgi:hypothetical protein
MGRTRACEIVIENNVLIGGLSFYGEADLEWESPEMAQVLEDLETLLQPDEGRGPVLFDGFLGVAHVRNNHLTQMFVSGALKQAFRELREYEGDALLETVFKKLHCTDNVIDGRLNAFVAEHVALMSNNFTLDAVRELAPEGDERRTLQVAVVVGDSGTYIGNHGRGTVPFLETVLRDITRASLPMGPDLNLELNVV